MINVLRSQLTEDLPGRVTAPRKFVVQPKGLSLSRSSIPHITAHCIDSTAKVTGFESSIYQGSRGHAASGTITSELTWIGRISTPTTTMDKLAVALLEAAESWGWPQV